MLLIRTERRFPAMVLLPLSRCRAATAWLRIWLLWRRGLGRGNMEIRMGRAGIALVTRAVFRCGSVRCHGAESSHPRLIGTSREAGTSLPGLDLAVEFGHGGIFIWE